jgi:two-component SAPR family response regulator
MAELYARALAEGIETDYVREAIRRLRIEPEGPVVAEAWPFEVKVSTLGRFAVLREDKPVAFARKAQRRPLELLQALVALGGREVREDALADALWPESEGDAAQRALTTNLHRLRKLLGGERAISVHDRKVSFNERVVWLDVWALQALLERIETRLGSADPCPAEEVHRLAGQLLNTYRGAFLAAEVDRPWAAPLRERLRGRFVSQLGRLGRLLEEEGRFGQAEEVYRRGLEADEGAEGFYQGLIRSHLALGQRLEAASAYERCRRVLARDLGIEPTPETQALAGEAGARGQA